MEHGRKGGVIQRSASTLSHIFAFFAFLLAILGGPIFVHGDSRYFSADVQRPIGILLIAAVAVVLFYFPKWWVHGAVSVLAWGTFRCVGALLFVVFAGVPSRYHESRGSIVLECLLLIACFSVFLPFATRRPNHLELAALIFCIFGLAFSLVYRSPIPLGCGIAVLIATHGTHALKLRRKRLHRHQQAGSG